MHVHTSAILACVVLLACHVDADIHRTRRRQPHVGADYPQQHAQKPDSGLGQGAALVEPEDEARFLDAVGREGALKLEAPEGGGWRTWTYALVGAGLVGLSGIFPLVFIPLEAGENLRSGSGAATLQLLLAFAVGGLLGDVFLHLLPEAWGHVASHQDHTYIGLWVLAGLLSFCVVEKVASFAQLQEQDVEIKETKAAANSHMKNGVAQSGRTNGVHKELLKEAGLDGGLENNNGHKYNLRHRTGGRPAEPVLTRLPNGGALVVEEPDMGGAGEGASETPEEERIHDDHEHHFAPVTGYLNLFANCVDNFTHGLAVGGSFLVSTKCGIVTTLAILIHEIPHEVGDFAILLRSGFSRWGAAKAQLLTASGGMLGAVAALSVDSVEGLGTSTAWLLPFISGGFLHVALVNVLPEVLQAPCADTPKNFVRHMLSVFAGVLVMYAVTVISD